MGWEVGGKFKREGTYTHLWLIHVDAWQKPTQYCKVIIPQLKIQKRGERSAWEYITRKERRKEVRKKEVGRQKKDEASN